LIRRQERRFTLLDGRVAEIVAFLDADLTRFGSRTVTRA